MLRDRMWRRLRGVLFFRGEMQLGDLRRVDALIPEFERMHRRVDRHVVAVGCGRGHCCLGVARLGEPEMTTGYSDARGQPFEVPLPRRGQRLVEIVDIENEMPLRRGEAAEVHQVRITTRLYPDPAYRGFCKVESHEGGGAAEKCERRMQHTAVTDRHKLRNAAFVGRLEHRHDVAALAVRDQLRMRLPRCLRP